MVSFKSQADLQKRRCYNDFNMKNSSMKQQETTLFLELEELVICIGGSYSCSYC